MQPTDGRSGSATAIAAMLLEPHAGIAAINERSR